jgi:hypothetical protein
VSESFVPGIESIRDVAVEIAVALRDGGAVAEANMIDAAAALGGAPPEQLLELRSALVGTRNRWERLEDRTLVRDGGRALAAAKRLSIDL